MGARIEEEQFRIEEEQDYFEEEQAMIEEEERRIEEEEQDMIEAEEEAMRMRERFPFKPKAGFCDEEKDCSPWGLCNMEKQRCECFDGWEGPFCKRKVRKTPLVARNFGEPRFPRFPFEDEEEPEQRFPTFGGRFPSEDEEERGPKFPNFGGRFPFAFEDQEERAPKGFLRSRVPPLPTMLDDVDDFAPCYGSRAYCVCRFSEDPDCIRKFLKSRKAFSS